MEILKYIDVLIGLALVMVLLSPMVSALTQLVLWASKVRPVRLRLALTTLIKELNGEAFDLYDVAVLTGLPANAQQVEFQQPGQQAPVTVAVIGNAARVDRNVGAMLRTNVNAAGQADLRPAFRLITAAGNESLPATTVITLQPRGTRAFKLTSNPTDADGGTAVTYKYDGPVQFAGRQFVTTVNPPGGTVTAAIIDSGLFKGTVLQSGQAGVYLYPDNVRPLPTTDDLRLTVTGGHSGDVATLSFPGDRTYDQQNPVPGTVGLFEQEAKDLAGKVLAHPMIGKPATVFKWLRKWDWLKWGEVVEREELIRILLGFASTDPRLRALLAQNGISDPEQTLADIREAAQRLEAERPELANHDRVTQAILESARSSFVGRINNWFDQIMDRTTVEYKFRAQLITVVAAFFVASTIQMDSIDLLRRLSSDDKLRDSLVAQAQQQQTRLDEQSKKGPDTQDQGELQIAKSRRDEIEANLANLRDPQLNVLPDHFIWQPLPKARLMRNEQWTRPAKRLELVVGTSAFPIEPRWTSDLLTDIEDGIRTSDAPVSLSRDQKDQFTVTSSERGPDIDGVQITIGTGEKVISGFAHTASLAKTSLKDPTASDILAADMFLIVGYEPHYRIHLTALDNASLAKALIASHAELSVAANGTNDIILQAIKPETRWIELRLRDEDPKTNILKPVTFSGGSASYDARLFTNAKSCTATFAKDPIDPCTLGSVEKALKANGLQVTRKTSDYLVLTSHRMGALQLRSVPGKSESNILNKAVERSCNYPVCFDTDLFSKSWRGIMLTWILLSLGAPFWYDALKDLLKLRSSVAKKEEDARKDRQTTNSPTAEAKPAK